MPNRIIKETILTSPNFNKLSVQIERHFYRVLLLVDDYGCYEAHPLVVKGRAYPLQPKVSARDIEGWQRGLEKLGIVKFWGDLDGRQYGVVVSFDKHNSMYSVSEDGKPLKHRRKTPPPPEDLLSEEEREKRKRALPANELSPLVQPCPELSNNPNPNPNPNHNHTIVPDGTHSFLKFFGEMWSKKVGKGDIYPCNFGKEGKLAKSLLKIYPYSRLCELVTTFFDSEDEWLKDKGWTVGIFKSHIPKLIAKKEGKLDDIKRRTEKDRKEIAELTARR